MLFVVFSFVVLCLSLCVTSQTCSYSACVNVLNNCGSNLFIQRTNLDGPEGTPTSVTSIPSGSSKVMDISGWIGMSGQRLYAWWKNPVGSNLDPMTYRDKVEINLCQTSPVRFCYNPTAVDYYGLPVFIGPTSNANCLSVSATGTGSQSVSSVRTNCITNFVSTPPFGVCQSPQEACPSNPTLPICSALDPTLQQCISDGICPSGSTSLQVYGCSSWFSSQPGYCASLNRGVYPSLSQNDSSQFYLKVPFNNYSAVIHTKGANEYGFPYDDYEGDGTSGYRECTTNMLTVHWCPSS
jgi:hypothetical protein